MRQNLRMVRYYKWQVKWLGENHNPDFCLLWVNCSFSRPLGLFWSQYSVKNHGLSKNPEMFSKQLYHKKLSCWLVYWSVIDGYFDADWWLLMLIDGSWLVSYWCLLMVIDWLLIGYWWFWLLMVIDWLFVVIESPHPPLKAHFFVWIKNELLLVMGWFTDRHSHSMTRSCAKEPCKTPV